MHQIVLVGICEVCCLLGLLQLLACIGEQFTEGDEVCGIVVNMRAKQDKLCLWSKTAANEASQVRKTKILVVWVLLIHTDFVLIA